MNMSKLVYFIKVFAILNGIHYLNIIFMNIFISYIMEF